MSILKPKNFKESEMSFSEVKTNQYGGKAVYLRYNDNKFRVQTPKMYLPYGLNEDEVTDDKTGEVMGHKYSINLSFKGIDKKEGVSEAASKHASKLQEFHDMLTGMNDQILKEASQKSMGWLRQKNADINLVRALNKPILQQSVDKETGEPDGKWPDTLKAKCPIYEGKFKTEVYDEKKEPVDLKEWLVKGAEVVCLLECTGIWFAGSKFGVGWKVVQCQVKFKPQENYGYCAILADSDDEDEDDAVVVNVSDQVVETDSNSNDSNDLDEGVNDDDDDDDDEEDDEEEEIPAPKKVKGTKKK